MPIVKAQFNGGTVTHTVAVVDSVAGVEGDYQAGDVLLFDDAGTCQAELNAPGSHSAYLEILQDASGLLSGNIPIRFVDFATGRKAFFVSATGAVVTGANAAPADGVLVAGQMALWFDATNGASKLMIKAKSANGTVVTGSVNLA